MEGEKFFTQETAPVSTNSEKKLEVAEIKLSAEEMIDALGGETNLTPEARDLMKKIKQQEKLAADMHELLNVA